MEEAYVMKDPFSEERGFITLGYTLSQDCSLFYTKRFCLQCVRRNLNEFPAEVKEEMARKSSKNEYSETRK